MSPVPAPQIGVQLVQSEETAKFRILVTVAKDHWLDLQFILTAEQAQQMADDLYTMAREARGRSIIIAPPGLGGGRA